MIYYKHFETGEPQCESYSIEGFMKKVNKKFPSIVSTFQKVRFAERVSEGYIIGILIQSIMKGTVTIGTSAVLVYQN